MTGNRINYVGSAVAALDQALNADGTLLNRADGIRRAEVFALLAIADELRQAREAAPAWPADDIAVHAAANREGRRP